MAANQHAAAGINGESAAHVDTLMGLMTYRCAGWIKVGRGKINS